MELNSQIALVTGSTGVLGRQIALALARAGCFCICHYHRNEQRALGLVEQIGQMGQKAVAVGADLAADDGPERLFGQLVGFRPTILINSAAIFERQRLADITADSARRMMGINFVAPTLVAGQFAARLGDSGRPTGRIVNITDVGGVRPWADYLLYCASKAALIAATKAMAKELAPDVLVNSVAPGMVRWPEMFDQAEKDRQLGFIPMGRLPDFEEVTQAVIFLLQSDYITGQVLHVDGGRCI